MLSTPLEPPNGSKSAARGFAPSTRSQAWTRKIDFDHIHCAIVFLRLKEANAFSEIYGPHSGAFDAYQNSPRS